jgi:hypothetical protein
MNTTRVSALAGLLAWAVVLGVALPARGNSDPPAPTLTTLDNGSTLSYGVTLSLLQFSTVRSPSESGRLRDYSPSLEVLPTEIGFQFIYNPQYSPWRLTKQDGSPFQLMSIGGALLARVKSESLAQGNISLAIELGFFNNAISIGIGVDLYRGIPILSSGGVPGGGTAYTGLLASAFAKEGEVTPENAFVLVSFSLSSIVGALSGKVQ